MSDCESPSVLFSAAHKDSSFDVVLSGVVPESTTLHSFDVFAEVARILKPGGRFYFKEPGCISGSIVLWTFDMQCCTSSCASFTK